MTSYIKLNGFTNESVPGGTAAVAMGLTLQITPELTAEFPVPFIPIGGGLAIAPVFTPDGDAAIRMDLTRWSPVHVTARLVADFPVNFNDQATAAKVARAFNADPTTSWTDPTPAVVAWLRTWGPANGLEIGGLA